uniref:hypothetical protein n=1 Tax=Alcaligenes xylosoxydans xylosoxydans TaxID=85698 RepID=UPI00159613F1|nr:hypothetical protein [Achromobacter xylosoxidans]
MDAANARSDAAERRALLEIDQERQARIKADKQLEALRGTIGAGRRPAIARALLAQARRRYAAARSRPDAARRCRKRETDGQANRGLC